MTIPPRWQNLSQLAFRVLFSLIFVVAGTKHLLAPDDIASRLMSGPGAALVTQLAPARLLVILAGIALFAGGLGLMTGLLTRITAVGLALVLIPITLTVQIGSAEGLGPLFKNIALLGGLLHWASQGGGPLSLDAWVASRPRWRSTMFLCVGALTAALAVPALAAPPTRQVAVTSKGEPSAGERIFFLVQQPPQLKAALATGEEALAGRGFPATDVEILVCGPAISSLLAGDAMEPLLVGAKKKGVRVVACGITLAEKGIAPEKLSPSVGVVQNGLVEALQRQAEGFRSVEL